MLMSKQPYCVLEQRIGKEMSEWASKEVSVIQPSLVILVFVVGNLALETKTIPNALKLFIPSPPSSCPGHHLSSEKKVVKFSVE